MKQYTKALFYINDSPNFVGYHVEGDNWNGFSLPCFERSEAEKIVADFEEQRLGHGQLDKWKFKYKYLYQYRYDPNQDCLEKFPVIHSPVYIEYQGNKLQVYDIGNYSLAWEYELLPEEQVNQNVVDAIPGGTTKQSLTIVFNVVYGYFLKIDSYSMLNGIVVRIDPIQADRLRIDGVDQVYYPDDSDFWNAYDILPLSVPNEVFKRNNSLNNLTGLL